MQTFNFTAGLSHCTGQNKEMQNQIMAKEKTDANKHEIVQNEYQPNEETLEAMKELREGGGVMYDSFEDMMRDLLR